MDKMEVKEGFPNMIMFSTPLHNIITISTCEDYLKVEYRTKDGAMIYKILEGKKENLRMNK